jgi:hypothetical protein
MRLPNGATLVEGYGRSRPAGHLAAATAAQSRWLLTIVYPTFRTPEYALIAIFSGPNDPGYFWLRSYFAGTKYNKGRLLHGESIFA